MSDETLISVQQAMNRLKKEMKDDNSYAHGWHCNIAMAAQDEGVDFETAQRIASRFMTTFEKITSNDMLKI